jgi:nucleoid DNA-binding protein
MKVEAFLFLAGAKFMSSEFWSFELRSFTSFMIVSRKERKGAEAQNGSSEF